MARDNPAVQIRDCIRQDRCAAGSRLPSLGSELIDASSRLSAEVACQLELALSQDADRKGPRSSEKWEGSVPRIYAQGDQKRVKADLRNPGSGEPATLDSVRHPNDIEAIRKSA